MPASAALPSGNPRPVVPPPSGPTDRVRHPGVNEPTAQRTPEIPTAERAFFLAEFAGTTIVVSLPRAPDAGIAALVRSLDGFASGDTRFVVVVPDAGVADTVTRAAAVVGHALAVHPAPAQWDVESLAELWIVATDRRIVLVVAADPLATARTAGFVSARLRATKLVLTDDGGGWGSPPRSFVELTHYRDTLAVDLAERGDPELLPAAEVALRGGASSVNLCRPEDLEIELFTFDGAGSVLTLGGYVRLSDLRVEDLPAVERLVAQGVAEGILKPRTRAEVARMAVDGLGARVTRTGHLAGIVGLETERYAGTGLGEISGLITVSEFSGSGSGGLLVDGLAERAAERGLHALFAVTVSDEAALFFARRGFREVAREVVPAAKWTGYDPARLAAARCFWRAL